MYILQPLLFCQTADGFLHSSVKINTLCHLIKEITRQQSADDGNQNGHYERQYYKSVVVFMTAVMRFITFCK